MSFRKRNRESVPVESTDRSGDIYLESNLESSLNPGDALLATLEINLDREIKRCREEYGGRTLSYSRFVTYRFTQMLGIPRIGWHVNHAMKLRHPNYRPDDFTFELDRSSREEALQKFAALPSGTKIKVAASPQGESDVSEHHLTVQYQNGESEQLSWPIEAKGMMLEPAEEPNKILRFVVGENNSRLRFTEFSEPVILDDDKLVILTFTPQSEDVTNFNAPETNNFLISFKLPEAYDQRVEIPTWPYSY